MLVPVCPFDHVKAQPLQGLLTLRVALWPPHSDVTLAAMVGAAGAMPTVIVTVLDAPLAPQALDAEAV